MLFYTSQRLTNIYRKCHFHQKQKRLTKYVLLNDFSIVSLTTHEKSRKGFSSMQIITSEVFEDIRNTTHR